MSTFAAWTLIIVCLVIFGLVVVIYSKKDKYMIKVLVDTNPATAQLAFLTTLKIKGKIFVSPKILKLEQIAVGYWDEEEYLHEVAFTANVGHAISRVTSTTHHLATVEQTASVDEIRFAHMQLRAMRALVRNSQFPYSLFHKNTLRVRNWKLPTRAETTFMVTLLNEAQEQLSKIK